MKYLRKEKMKCGYSINQNPVSYSRRQQSKVDNTSTTARQNQVILIVFLVLDIKDVYYICEIEIQFSILKVLCEVRLDTTILECYHIFSY